MTRTIKRRLLATSGCLAALLTPAFAQDDPPLGQDVGEVQDVAEVDEIVVTSRFREETIQDIGASVTALTGETLAERQVEDFEDLAQLVAGVQVIKFQPNTNDVSIRGVQNAQYGNGPAFTSSPVVSLFVDDVAVSGPTSAQRDFNYFDFDRTEILRGPQPTLFGEGAVGGAVRYFSADPDLDGERLTGMARGLWQTYEDGASAYRAENATSLILIPGKLGVRLVGTYRDDGGFIDNPNQAVNEEDVNDYEAVGGRAVILAQPTDALTVRLSAFIGRDDLGERTQIDPDSDPDDLTFSAAPLIGESSDDFELYVGKLIYDFGSVEATSITGLYEREGSTSAFSAANTFGLVPFLPGFDTTSTEVSSQGQETFSQEFRFVSDLDGPLNVTAGLFYNQTDGQRDALVRAPGLAEAITPASETLAIATVGLDIEEYSGFAELTWDVTDRLRLIGGTRYVHEDLASTLVQQRVPNILPIVPIPQESLPLPVVDAVDLLALQGVDSTFTFELREWLPRGAIEYDATDNVLLYANVAKGVRNGNLNSPTSVLGVATNPLTGEIDFDLFLDLLEIGEDEILTYDVGAKSTLFDGQMVFNVGAFYSQYEDTQITAALPANAVLNGPDQEIYGLEVETTYAFNDDLTGFANVTLLDTSFEDDFSSTRSPIIDVPAGSEAGNQPNVSFSLGYDYGRPIGSGAWDLVSTGSFSFIGERFSQPQNVPSTALDSLSLLNLSVGLQSDRLRVDLFGQNLLNDVERVVAISSVLTGAANVGADGRITDLDRQFASVNAPRSVGVQLTLNY